MKRLLPRLLPVVVSVLWPTSARASDAITELAVIYGDSSSIQCPAGFTKLEIDLNQGAGGDFIYLCLKRGVGAPITGLDVSLSRSAISAADVPEPWIFNGVDLNRNAGGFYVYLSYRKDPGYKDVTNDPEAAVPDCRVVTDIIVGSSSTPPSGYVQFPFDLNRDTDKTGTTLYLSYSKGCI